MRRAVNVGLVAMLATQVLVIGQGQDVAKILADVRAALGGDATLAGLKTLTVEGKTTRSMPNGTSQSSNFDLAFELPSKFSRKDVLGNFNGMEIARTAGFNGDGLIEVFDTPQMGGGMVFTRADGGGPKQIGGTAANLTPDQVAQQRQATLLGNKKDFAKLTLGMFATSFPAYPLEFSYGGVAEAPEGKAHVIDVKGADNFVAKLFIDTESHLPLMLSWMDKEPLQMVSGGGVPMVRPGSTSGTQLTRGGGAGGGQTVVSGGASGWTQTMRGVGPGGRQMTPEEIEKMRADFDARMKEAEARRRVVEYRMFYADYKSFDGVRLPTRIQRMIDGNPTEEIEFEKVRVNGRIDQKKFEVVK